MTPLQKTGRSLSKVKKISENLLKNSQNRVEIELNFEIRLENLLKTENYQVEK